MSVLSILFYTSSKFWCITILYLFVVYCKFLGLKKRFIPRLSYHAMNTTLVPFLFIFNITGNFTSCWQCKCLTLALSTIACITTILPHLHLKSVLVSWWYVLGLISTIHYHVTISFIFIALWIHCSFITIKVKINPIHNRMYYMYYDIALVVSSSVLYNTTYLYCVFIP